MIYGKENREEHYNQEQYNYSIRLLDIIKRYADQQDSILEIGSSFGRNLEILQDNGFKNLTGLDPDENAIKGMRAGIKGIVGTMQEKLKDMPQYDIVFTKSVLYLTKNPNFREIVNKVKKFLIVSEGETIPLEKDSFLQNRNYKEIFEQYGLKQIEEQEGLFPYHKIRIFKC